MRWRPFVLLGVPILLVAAAVTHLRWEESAAREDLIPPGQIRWQLDGRPITLRVQREMDHELERVTIDVLARGESVTRIGFEIDHDMFGGGFIGGLDIDDDGEQELVLATRAGPRVSRVVEPGAGGLLEQSFDQLPDSAWRAIEPRLARIAPTLVHMLTLLVAGLWLIAAVLVYILSGLGLLLRLLRRRR